MEKGDQIKTQNLSIKSKKELKGLVVGAIIQPFLNLLDDPIQSNINYYIDKSFSSRLVITYPAAIRAVMKALSKYDPKSVSFNTMNDTIRESDIGDIVSGSTFMVKLSKVDYCRVTHTSSKYSMASVTFKFYGVHREYFYNKFSKLVTSVSLKGSECNVNAKKAYLLDEWRMVSPVIVKSKDEIVLVGDQKDRIFNYIENWNKDAEFFKRKNIPHQLGILLYGPGGTGKSSLVSAIIGMFPDRYVYYINSLSYPMNDSMFNDKCIIVIEDIAKLLYGDSDNIDDNCINDGDEDDKNKKKPMRRENGNIRKIMQLLDSSTSVTDKIVIVTTNDYDIIMKRDPNLLRNGRFSIIEEIGCIGEPEVRKLAKRYEVDYDEIKDKFEYPILPVDAISIFMKHHYDQYKK